MPRSPNVSASACRIKNSSTAVSPWIGEVSPTLRAIRGGSRQTSVVGATQRRRKSGEFRYELRKDGPVPPGVVSVIIKHLSQRTRKLASSQKIHGSKNPP